MIIFSSCNYFKIIVVDISKKPGHFLIFEDTPGID